MNSLVAIVLIFTEIFYTMARRPAVERGAAADIWYLSPAVEGAFYGVILLLGVVLFFRGETKTQKIAPVATILTAAGFLALMAMGKL